jgi:hypothetical protein
MTERRTVDRPAPGPVRLHAARLQDRVATPVRRRQATRQVRPQRSVTGAEKAWRGRKRVALARVISYGGGALLLLWLARSSYVVFLRKEPWTFPPGFNPDVGCRMIGSSCGAVTGIVVTWLSLAAGTALFLLRRLRAVVKSYGERAEKRPSELVLTASGGIVDDVVGRNDLCRVIIDDLRESGDRRPHILIGGVGTGKTAVLVLLTRLLAECGATPVPIRLRDAQGELNFLDLARSRFLAQVDQTLISQSEGDRIWRYLLKNDRIVVLADGLEEALSGKAREKDRDNIIRLAIKRANESKPPWSSHPVRTIRCAGPMPPSSSSSR